MVEGLSLYLHGSLPNERRQGAADLELDVRQVGDHPVVTGPKPENPYCMRCSSHLGKPFHETNEHDQAKMLSVTR